MRTRPLPTIDDVRERLAADGIDHVGVCDAAVLTEARAALHERKAAGLHGGMGFTYRNPDRSTDPGRAVEGARSIIVAARPYLPSDPDERGDPREPNHPDEFGDSREPSGPNERGDPREPSDPDERGDPRQPSDAQWADDRRPVGSVGKYAWVDHYAPLLRALRDLCRDIRRAGHRAVAFADDNSLVDRAVAHRAGLGWYGKNANLLLPGAGSFFVLGSIVTSAVYEPAAHPVADGCGACRRCIDACPTAAIIDDAVVDGRRCLSWVGQRAGTIPPELRAPLGDHLYGCDDCQDVCPISVRLGRRNTIDLRDLGPVGRVDLLELLECSDDELLRRHGRWYIADRQPRWLRRNALVILGNVADPADPVVRSMLDRYSAGADTVLAEHARWALDRLIDRTLQSSRA